MHANAQKRRVWSGNYFRRPAFQYVLSLGSGVDAPSSRALSGRRWLYRAKTDNDKYDHIFAI